MTSAQDKYYMLYGSLITLLCEEMDVDDGMLDEVDAVLTTTMLGEIARSSL